MTKNIIIALIFVGVGFFGGLTYQKSKTPVSEYSNQFIGNRNSRSDNTQPRRMGDSQVVGEISSISDNSITIKMTDGSSKLILISDKTNINKASIAAKTDLKVGERASVFGKPNTDGSITGQNIQLNPNLPQK